MLSSRRSTSGEAQELLLQERLQILLERLQWSYVALWTLNPHSRVLEWKRGHFSSQVETSNGSGTARATSSQPKLDWYEQQFYATYRSCSFTPGSGFVGRSNLEGRHIWLSGDSVFQNAGTLEQSQFLSHAKIKTVMCIPWLNNVLELGTTNFVGESFQLMDQIQQVLCHDLLSVPPLDDVEPGFATTNASQAAALQHQPDQSLHLPDPAQLNHPGGTNLQPASFDVNMSDHLWRSDMMFMQEQDSLPDLAAAWRAVGAVDQYAGTITTTTTTTQAAATASSSASVSSHVDQYSNSFSALDRASSTGRLAQLGELHVPGAAFSIKHELYATGARNYQNINALRRTTSCSDQYEIQKALSLFEAQEMEDQWRQHGLNPVSEAAEASLIGAHHDQPSVSFHSWQHDPMSLSDNLSNQTDSLKKQVSNLSPRARQLQRRHTLSAMEVLQEVDTYHQQAANSSYFQIRADSSSQPGDVRPSADHVQMSAPNLRGRSRATSSSRGSGVAAAHDEAALNHMMAERRRRVKQKENFATLRRLVPIISKADKASTLVDAIAYLKDLQSIIADMKANEDDVVRRCEDLATKCVKLEEQNKELVAILSKDKPPGGGVVHLNTLKLHSMKSL